MRELVTSRAPALAVSAAAVAVGLAVVFDVPALRMVLALAICLLLPGWGWARRFRPQSKSGRRGDRGDTLALALVLSICATVVVATTMVMTARWSMPGGLAALVLIGAAGFVPEQKLLAKLHVARPLRPAAAGHHPGAQHEVEWTDWYRRAEAHAAAEQQQAEGEWVDWYAGARRRAAEERARTRALQREADAQWAEWFRTTHPERAAKKK